MRIFVAAILAITVAACGASGATSTPDLARAAIPSTITRDQAIAVVRGLEWVARVDRADAKLMSYAEYVRIAGPVRTHPSDPSATPMTGFGIVGDPEQRYVWVVAVSGQVYPQGREATFFGHQPAVTPTPYPPYRWGMYLVDSVRGQVMTIGDAGASEDWPPIFATLPDHPASAYVVPSATPSLRPLVVQHLAPEAMTDAMRLAKRVDRVQVKLMTWAEYAASADPIAQPPKDVSPDAPVWIVAISGEIIPDLARGVSFPWAVYAVDPFDERIRSTSAGQNGAWPLFFDRLPDHPVAPR